MPLEPDVAAFLEAAGSLNPFPADALSDPVVSSAYLTALRATSRPAENAGRCPVARLEEVRLDSGVKLRVYVPEATAVHPLLVFFHGGGWVMGDLETHDMTCRVLATEGGFTVVSVDYRLAPAFRFPTPLNDCLEALVWACAHAADFSADASHLIVAGSSAGANLAASLALKIRDEGGPAISVQALICPVTDSRLESASMRNRAEGYFLSRGQLEWFWAQYLGDDADRTDPLASPMHAASLAGLPSAIVITAEYDPLRDQGAEYAARLAADGVPTLHRDYPGQIHGFMGLVGLVAEAAPAVRLLAADIGTALSAIQP